jgi:hypothetical protein
MWRAGESHIIGAAVFYREACAMGAFEDMAARVPRLVRVICRGISDDDADEVTQLVLVHLLEKLTVRYVWTTILNTWREILKKRGRQGPIGDDPAEDYCPPEDQDPVGRVPLAVVLERLRIVDECGVLPALAFGYRHHLNYTLESIALHLAGLRLEDLATSLVESYANAVEVQKAQVAESFVRTLSVVGTPEGATKFGDHWDPETWVRKCIDELECETPDCSGLKESAKQSPNRRIMFVFGSRLGLGYPAARIVAELGNHTLEHLQTRFEAECNIKDPPPLCPCNEWKEVARVSGPPAKRTLQSYYTPPRIIDRWISNAKDSLEKNDLLQEKLGLRTIFEFTMCTPQETVALLYNASGFLGLHEETLRDVFRSRGMTVGCAAQSLIKGYSKKWQFEEHKVVRWFRPLTDELEEVSKDRMDLYLDSAENIKNAREKAIRHVKPRLHRAGLPLFCWRHKLL